MESPRHELQVFVDPAQRIEAGQRIAHTSARRPMVFELWHNGSALDPREYIVLRFSAFSGLHQLIGSTCDRASKAYCHNSPFGKHLPGTTDVEHYGRVPLRSLSAAGGTP